MFDFGAHLKAIRKSKKITQKQLAQAIDITERGLQSYELNEKKPSFENIIALANYLQISTDYLLGRIKNPNINPDEKTDNPNSHKS